MAGTIYGENGKVATISAVIEVATESFVLGEQNQTVFLEGCQEMFAVFGKLGPYDRMEYATVFQGVHSEGLDLNRMLADTKESNPELFFSILLAALNNAGEDELDAALDLAGWNPPDFLDIAIVINGDWLRRKLGEKVADELLEELIETLEIYLGENGYEELLSGVITYEDCDYCTECSQVATVDELEEIEELYYVEFASGIPIGIEEVDALEDSVEHNVLLPILKKYGLVGATENEGIEANVEAVAEGTEGNEGNMSDGSASDGGGNVEDVVG